MKKILCAALAALLLLACGCQTPGPDPAPDAPSPTPEAVPSPTAPEQTGPLAELPDFIAAFTFTQVHSLDVSTGEMRYDVCTLDDTRRAQLVELLDMAHWQTAADVPEMGLGGTYFLIDEEGHTLTLDTWNEDFCLVLGKDGNDSYLYFAPKNVLGVFNDYVSGLTYLPDFVADFQFDNIRLDHTPADDGDYYLDYAAYLLDEAQQARYLEILAPETWSNVTNFPAESYPMYSASYDLAGNRIDVNPWPGEEHCLINCFPAEGGVRRYWGSPSVLEDMQAFIESLSPLGYIDNTAKTYYDLFRADHGFDCLIALITPDGSISDDQMSAYVIETMAYAGLYEYDIGIPVSEFDAVTQKHFGRTIGNLDNSMTKPVEGTDSFTATGWDVPYGIYPVLSGEPQEDENGVVTAQFLCYALDDSLWWDDTFDQFKLDHRDEYLLTGNDGDFPEPQLVEIVFEIRQDFVENEGYSSPYVVYHSLKAAE